MDAPTELALAYLLSGIGVVALVAPYLIRIAADFAPDASANAGEHFPHVSTEVRLRRRLPLRPKLSALPNRALIGGVVMLLLLLPAFLMMDQTLPAKGFYVRLTPREFQFPLEDRFEGPIVVTVVESGQMLLNGKELTRDQLRPALKAALGRRRNWEVTVEGDDSASYADPMFAIEVINSLQARAVILPKKAKAKIAPDHCSFGKGRQD
jgi:biopolymer transport protein ExbD